MKEKTIIITNNQIKMIAENVIKKQSINENQNLIGDLGDNEDRKINYDNNSTNSEIENEFPIENPPKELIKYLDKIDEAKSILSKIAAKEKNDNMRKKLYIHYDKLHKTAFELIKDFNIVH